MSPDVCVVGSVTLVSALSVRLVFARSTMLMFIVALLHLVWFRRSCQEVGVAGSWCRRKFVSPGAVLGRPGAPVLGYDVLCAFVAGIVQLDPGGPKFVTARASRTPVSAQPQLDVVPIVIEIRVVVSSLGSWHAPFGGVGVASVGLVVFVYY